jgi:enoyl-CoA hydratase/carnithine racemase
MSEPIKLKEEGGVLEITFARPDKKNALSNAMYGTACEALDNAQRNQAVRVVLFSSEGGAFTAGNDMAEFASVASGQSSELLALRFVETLARFEKPIVAAVPGLAVGVGATMLLHCDLVYVTDNAKLSTPFVNLALVPEAASSLLLPSRIGHVRAFAMFALGESISGAEAVALGLANKMVPQDELLTVARAAAKTLAQKPPASIQSTKRLMREVTTLLARIDAESLVFGECLRSDETREALRAFAERRSPDFSKFS